MLTCVSIAQNKKDNIIVAHGADFKNAVNILLDGGYTIEEIDSKYETVRTEYKALCRDCVPEIMLDIRVKQNNAIVKGKWRSNGGIIGQTLSGNSDTMYFDKMHEKSKVPKMCFNEMNRIAMLLSKNVDYTKQLSYLLWLVF